MISEEEYAMNVQICPLPTVALLFRLLENLKNLIKNPRKDDYMPHVTVKYLMTFSQVTGKQSERMEIEKDATIKDLLDSLYNRYGRKFRKLVEQDFENRSVIFAVNGESKDFNSLLNEGDEVLISYPVGGG
jgi:MoaD family protein